MTISCNAILAWLNTFAALIAENKDALTDLDSAIGDADHGVNMDRGMQAVIAKLPGVADKDIGVILKTVGMTLLSTVGGTSGPLYGTLFIQMGAIAAGKDELSLSEWATGLEMGVNGIIMRGKAQPGDKTMVDALTPAVAALHEAVSNGATVRDALRQCAKAADDGQKATIPLVARKGRASYLGERSAGHQDPGATSAAMLLSAAASSVENSPPANYANKK